MHVGIDKSKTSKGTILKLLLWNKSPKENVVLEKLCLCKTISEVRGFPVLLLRKMSFLKLELNDHKFATLEFLLFSFAVLSLR